MRSRGAPGTEGNGPDSNQRLVGYLTMMLRGSNMSLDEDSQREMRTLAEAIDNLNAGDLAGLGDLLMQRFKSKENAALTGSTELARHLELIPPLEGGLLSTGERTLAAKTQLQEARILEAGKRAKGI